jgi:DNA repair protein RadA/Sms
MTDKSDALRNRLTRWVAKIDKQSGRAPDPVPHVKEEKKKMADVGLKFKSDITPGVDIRDIVVPPELRRRAKTGIKFFDDIMGGEGLVPSMVTMLTGDPGAGKSTLVRQMADSLTKEGHTVLYNTGEESPYQVAMQCEKMGLKNGFHVGIESKVSDLLALADKLRKPGKELFLLQDSLQTLDDGFYSNGGTNSMTAVRSTEMLVNWAKATYSHVIFVGQNNKSGDFAGKNAIKHAVDAHVKIYFDKDKKSDTFGARLFAASKNRWGVCGIIHQVSISSKGVSSDRRVE